MTDNPYSCFYYGDVGSGKTLRAVMDAYFDFCSGRQIWSNIDTLKLPQVYITAYDLINIIIDPNINISNEPAKTLIIDETHTQADSRTSSSWINRHLTYFFSQSRKMGFNVIYVSQFLTGYDIRMRQLTKEVIRCIRKTNRDGDLTGFEYVVWDTIDQKLTKRYTIPTQLAQWFYQLYDTYGKIRPIGVITS